MLPRVGLLFCALLVLLAACTSKATPLPGGPTAPATLVPSHTSIHTTASPKPMLVPSATPLPPSLMPTDTLMPTPDSGVRQRCINIQPALPPEHTYQGILALENAYPEEDELALLDLASGNIHQITDAGKLLAISPDHSRFAYQTVPPNRLEVFAWDGEPIKSVAWKETWLSLDRWLDNETVLITLNEPASLPGELRYPPRVQVLNPFTGHSQVLETDYPDIDIIVFEFSPWPPSSITIYSPDLKRVVYLGGVDVDGQRMKGYSLYAIPEQKKLAGIPNFSWLDPPVWSPDGSKFVMEGDRELYVVGYDGAVSQATHLNPERVVDVMNEGVSGVHYDPFAFSWSPDNRHIALWLGETKTEQYSLAVVDTQTGNVIDYCISIGEDGFYMSSPSTLDPVWAPDGTALVVAANFKDGTNDLILIDLEKETGFILSHDIFPAGWLLPQ